jgi:hypothetical protein
MDQRDDSIFPDAGHRNGSSEGGTTDSTAVSQADPPALEQAEGVAAGLRPGFLAELAVAMRSTAEKERERIAGKVSDDAAAHVEKVRARAAIETDELKRLAEEDVQHIEEWAVAEQERIRGEADRKIEDRRASLEEYLKQHDTIIDTEIDGVNAAVRDYNTTLDRYFEELAQSNDPASIVARAEALPAPPDLDQIRAQARARAVSMFAEREDDAPAAPAAPAAQSPAVAEMSGPAPAAEPSMAESSMAEVGAVAEESAPVAESSVGSQPVLAEAEATADSVMAEAAAEPLTAEAEATAEPEPMMAEAAAEASAEPVMAESGLIGDTPAVEEPAATAEPTPVEAEPVPVMDPAATANPSWPAATSEPEREPVAATVDHTSAAVRLLRSVAPWTAPTHAGSNDRSESE